MRWERQKNYYNLLVAIHVAILVTVSVAITITIMAKKNLVLPISKTEGYITNEEICKEGFEMIGFFDGYNIYKKIKNETGTKTTNQQ